MWYKANIFGDTQTQTLIENQTNPKEVKKLGRLVKGFDETKWCELRTGSMFIVCYNKFDQNKAMKKELLETGSRHLVEASPYDKVWGVGLEENDPLILDEKNWRGLNLLGKVLMDVRNQFEFEKSA